MRFFNLVALIALIVLLTAGIRMALIDDWGCAATPFQAGELPLTSFTIEKAPKVTVELPGTAVLPGQAVTFVLTTSATLSGMLQMDLPLVVTETLPAEAELLGATPGFSLTAGGLQWQRVISTGVGYEVVTFSVQLTDSLVAYTHVVNADYRARILGTEVRGNPVTLTVNLAAGVEITPSYQSQTATFGQRLTLAHRLTNTGNFSDTFYITGNLTSAYPISDWQVTTPPSMTVGPWKNTPVEVIVEVGQGVSGGAVSATLNLTVTSQNGAVGHATASIVAQPSYIYLPLVLRNYPPLPVIAGVTIEPLRGESACAYEPNVRVVVSATLENDIWQGVRFRNEGEAWGQWQTFTPTLPYSHVLSAGSGYKVVYVQVSGAKGGVSQPRQAAIGLLQNGDFASDLTQWNRVGRNLPAPTPTDDGRALMGNPSLSCHPIPIGESTLSQIVDLAAVPTGSTVALYLDYDIYTEDKFVGPDYDRFMVLVDGQEQHRDGYQGTEPFGCGKWHQVTKTGYGIDLTPYQGREINLLLGNYMRFDEWYNTYTFVDNVHIVVQP